MKKLVLFMLLIFAGSASYTYAQIGSDLEKRDRKRKSGSPFSDRKNWGDAIWSQHASQYRGFGWFINPGATYMVGHGAEDPADDSYNLTPTGLPGYYAEAGLAFLVKKSNKVLHYFDIGLGVKHFGGTEKYKTSTITERGHFNFGSAFFRGAAHHIWQLSKWNFFDNSIGANFDYRIYGGNADDTYAYGAVHPNPAKMTLQLNYSLGWGIKIRDGFFIIPTVQTPILSFFPDGLNPSLNWFSSKYQPTIFTIKFGWLFPKKGCNVPDDPRQKDANDRFEMN